MKSGISGIAKIFLFLLFINLLAWGALTQLRQVAIFNSTIDNTVIGGTGPGAGTFTTMKVNTGLTSAPGWQHLRATSCTTAGTAAAFCGTVITWPVPFANTNYTVVCSVQSGTLFLAAINNKLTTSITPVVELTPGNSGAASTEIDCIGIHDPV